MEENLLKLVEEAKLLRDEAIKLIEEEGWLDDSVDIPEEATIPDLISKEEEDGTKCPFHLWFRFRQGLYKKGPRRGGDKSREQGRKPIFRRFYQY